MRLLTATCAAAVLVCAAAPNFVQANPFAKPKSAKAQQHLKAGNKLVEVQKYDLAIKSYKDGYLIESAPVFLYNLALAHRKKGDLMAALDYYRNFLNRASTARAEVVKAVRKVMDEMQAKLKKREQEAAKLKPAATTKPPPRRVNWTADVVYIPPRWYSDRIGWAIAGTGLLLAGVGVGFRVSASSLRSDVKIEPDSVKRDELRDTAGTRETWGTVIGVAGSVGLVVGIMKLVIHPKKVAGRGHRVGVALRPNWVGLRGSF